jgi:hypothetical protein
MNRWSLVLIVILLPGLALSAEFSWGKGRVLLDRYGPVQVGMRLADAEKLLQLVEAPEIPSGTEGCHHVRSEPDIGVYFMVINGVIRRIDVLSPVVPTDRGAKVGMSERAVRDLFKDNLRIEPHKYVDEGHYLIVPKSQKAKRGLLFETDGKSVTAYRTGFFPDVLYVEFCN